MSAIIASLSELLRMLTDSFKLPALFPSLFFIILNQLFVIPQLKFLPFINDLTYYELKERAFLTGLIAILLGYTVNAIEVPIIRFYEGYPWKDSLFGKILTYIQRKKYTRLLKRLKHLSYEKMVSDEPGLVAEINDCKTELGYAFPPIQERILPTNLGNVIAAFESYPGKKYNMDGVVFWHRILPVLVKNEFSIYIAEHRSQVDFLLNTSFLMVIFSVECMLLRILVSPFIHWGLPISAIVLAFVFYRTAISSAYNWGGVFRAAFDLFRYQLADSLGLKPVEDFAEEREMWGQLTTLWSRLDSEGLTKLLHQSQNEFDGFNYNYGQQWPYSTSNSGDKK